MCQYCNLLVITKTKGIIIYQNLLNKTTTLDHVTTDQWWVNSHWIQKQILVSYVLLTTKLTSPHWIMPNFLDKGQFAGNVLAMCTLQKSIWKKMFAEVSFYLKAHKITLKYQWQTTSTPRKKNKILSFIDSTLVGFCLYFNILYFNFNYFLCYSS